jgi:uncharacterized RDD family membrane protein YckC
MGPNGDPSEAPVPPAGDAPRAEGTPEPGPDRVSPPPSPAPPSPPSVAPQAPQPQAPPPQAPPPPGWPGPVRRGPAPGLEYATFGSRLIAWIVDSVILGILTGVVSVLLGGGLVGLYGLGAFGFGRRLGFDFGLAGLGFIVVAGVLSGLYFVYSWTRNGASPGQSFLGLQVRNAADGARLSQEQAIRRWAFLTVPFVSFFPLVGLLVVLYQLYLAYTTSTDPVGQGFHDKEAGSIVVRRVG